MLEVEGFVACDKFQPTVLEGQMCYSMDLSKMGNSLAGKENGLTLVLDPKTFKKNESTKEVLLSRIYLHTLSSFTDFKSGTNSYALSSLKKITGASGFLNLPTATKECQDETFESCNTRRYLEKVRLECRCLLWSLDTNEEVNQTQPLLRKSFYLNLKHIYET